MGNKQNQLPSFVPSWAQPMVLAASQKYNIPAPILASLLQQESGYNIHAQSPAGAQGIAQFMPETASGMHINPFNPAQAIDGAAHYLRNAMDNFGGSIPLALAAYNAGSGAVKQYGGIPPFQETQNYVKNIMAMSGQTGAQPQGQAAPQQAPQQMPQQQGAGQIPPTQINNPAGQAPMPQMGGRMSPGGAMGGQMPAGQQTPSAYTQQNMNQYQSGSPSMMRQPMIQGVGSGAPLTAFNPNSPSQQQNQGQTPPTSVGSIIQAGNASAPSVSPQTMPTATPSSILSMLLGGSTG